MKRAVLCYADDVVEISADERMKYHIQMKYDGIQCSKAWITDEQSKRMIG